MMSFKDEIIELRRTQRLRTEEICLEHIKQIIRKEICENSHKKIIYIEYDDIFKADLHHFIVSALTKEGFRVAAYNVIGRCGVMAYVPVGIEIVVDDLK